MQALDVLYEPLFTPEGIERVALKKQDGVRRRTSSVDSSDLEEEYEAPSGVNRSELAEDSGPVFLNRNAERVRHSMLRKYQGLVYQHMKVLKAERDNELRLRLERSRLRRREGKRYDALLNSRTLRKMTKEGKIVIEN